MQSFDSEFHIEKIDFPTETVDLMAGASRWEVKLHEHGLLALVDVMPRLVETGQTADAAIVQAARVSYGQGTKKRHQDRGLIRYLMRHHHNTPFEMVELKFHVVAPLFVARQWIRHRTANINEYSARYSVLPARFYRPRANAIRQQSSTNRQGSESFVDEMTAADFLEYLDDVEASYQRYESLVERGVARELARVGQPVNQYTEWYWKCDLHNILHFLQLRMTEHAQEEIRDYAQAMFELIQPIAPMTTEAFLDYRLNGLHLTSLELEALRSGDEGAIKNDRERAEWKAKRKVLGI